MKLYIEFSTQKRMEAEKNNDKDGKLICRLTNNVYTETQWKT